MPGLFAVRPVPRALAACTRRPRCPRAEPRARCHPWPTPKPAACWSAGSNAHPELPPLRCRQRRLVLRASRAEQGRRPVRRRPVARCLSATPLFRPVVRHRACLAAMPVMLSRAKEVPMTCFRPRPAAGRLRWRAARAAPEPRRPTSVQPSPLDARPGARARHESAFARYRRWSAKPRDPGRTPMTPSHASAAGVPTPVRRSNPIRQRRRQAAAPRTMSARSLPALAPRRRCWAAAPPSVRMAALRRLNWQPRSAWARTCAGPGPTPIATLSTNAWPSCWRSR